MNPTRHVYFSLTEQNKFLPPWYITQLKEDLDPRLAERLLRGKWIDIRTDVIYGAYNESVNYQDRVYTADPLKPIYINWDFNIGEGKPLSLCLSQVNIVDGKIKAFHFFSEVIVEGADTEDACHELAARGLLDTDTQYIIHGDATGGSRSTKSKSSDYDIIKKYLSNYRTPDGRKLEFIMDVPASNPPVRTRHNLVNAYCRNDVGAVRLFVYQGCPKLNKGLKLTALKKGGNYIEDDSKDYQHVTTALGYTVCRVHGSLRSLVPSVRAVRVR